MLSCDEIIFVYRALFQMSAVIAPELPPQIIAKTAATGLASIIIYGPHHPITNDSEAMELIDMSDIVLDFVTLYVMAGK